MINPMNAMKMFNERKAFITNHPEFFDFVVNIFGGELGKDTAIELRVTKPGEEPRVSEIKVQETDLKLFQALRELIR